MHELANRTTISAALRAKDSEMVFVVPHSSMASVHRDDKVLRTWSIGVDYPLEPVFTVVEILVSEKAS